MTESISSSKPVAGARKKPASALPAVCRAGRAVKSLTRTAAENWTALFRCGLLAGIGALFLLGYQRFTTPSGAIDPWSYLHSRCPELALPYGTASEYGQAIMTYLEEATAHTGIEKALLLAVMVAESNCKVRARSRAGAIGLMQLMPKTARWLAVSDPYHPRENIFGGAKYLAILRGMFNGDIELMLAAYNAGPGTVKRYGGVPPYPETKRYVEKVFRHYRALQILNQHDDRLRI